MNGGSSPIAKARLSALLTQAEMAERLGVSVMTVSNWERNPDHYMNMERLRGYWDNVGDDGRRYLREYVETVFD